MEETRIHNFLAFSFATLVVFTFWFVPHRADAASVYFSPSANTVEYGDTFTVTAFVSTGGVNVNGFDGLITYPQDLVQITSLSQSGIGNFWVEPPTYSNGSGTVSFAGIVFNPGYNGSAGTMLSMSFKAIKSGTATIRLSGGSVLANDGLGTNVLTSLGSTAIVISGTEATPEVSSTPEEDPEPDPVPTEEPSVEASAKTPAAASVISATHPDPDAWYAEKNPVFSWGLPTGTTGVNIVADHESATNPGTTADGLFSSYSYDDVDDGVWYFHLRLQNSAGWGAVTHYRFQIDSVAPDVPTISLIEEDDVLSATTRVQLFSSDALSGVKEYRVHIDGGEELVLPAQEGGTAWTVPLQSPGDHELQVFAFDAAGNSSEATIFSYVVEKGIDAPTLVNVPERVKSSETLRVYGMSYQNSVVEIELTRENGETFVQETRTDAYGGFLLTWKRHLKPGSYTIRARVLLENGVVSEWSMEYPLTSESALPYQNRVVTLTFMTLIILLALLMLSLFALCVMLWLVHRRLLSDHSKTFAKVQDLNQEIATLKQTQKHRVRKRKTSTGTEKAIAKPVMRRSNAKRIGKGASKKT